MNAGLRAPTAIPYAHEQQHDPTLALRVAILAGGNSAEAQVSRNSAAQIEQAC